MRLCSMDWKSYLRVTISVLFNQTCEFCFSWQSLQVHLHS